MKKGAVNFTPARIFIGVLVILIAIASYALTQGLFKSPGDGYRVFESKGLLDSPVFVKIVPNKLSSRDEVIGFEIFTVDKSGEIGTAFLVHDSFYSLSPGELTHDQTYYRIEGVSSGEFATIAEAYSSKNWKSDDLTSFFATKVKIEQKTLSDKELEAVYDLYAQGFGIMHNTKVFTEDKGKYNEGTIKKEWGLGTLRIKNQDLYLKRSKKYANIFEAGFE